MLHFFCGQHFSVLICRYLCLSVSVFSAEFNIKKAPLKPHMQKLPTSCWVVSSLFMQKLPGDCESFHRVFSIGLDGDLSIPFLSAVIAVVLH